MDGGKGDVCGSQVGRFRPGWRVVGMDPGRGPLLVVHPVYRRTVNVRGS